MSGNNKAILAEANAAVTRGDYEGFLSFCTEDTLWALVGDTTLQRKKAVRQWMVNTYKEPPKLTVIHEIAEGDFGTVLGEAMMRDDDGRLARYASCDVWRFRGSKWLN